MIEPIPDNTGASRAIRRYLAYAHEKLPADTYARLEDVADAPSLVDSVVGAAELLYARRDELDDEGRTIIAQLASYAAVNGWHGMANGNRGGLIAQAMRRDLGLAVEAGQHAPQAACDDPAAKALHVRRSEA